MIALGKMMFLLADVDAKEDVDALIDDKETDKTGDPLCDHKGHGRQVCDQVCHAS
jgi:hypothetical protein